MRRPLLALLFLTFFLSSHSIEAQTLIHYWNFNNLTLTDTFPKIPIIKSNYSTIDTNKAYMLYTFDAGTSTKSMDSAWIDNVGGTTINAQQGAAAGNCLRVRNPTDFSQLWFYTPTTNYQGVSLSFALESSSVKSGPEVLAFAYSVDSGVTWKTSSLTVNGSTVDTLIDTAANPYINSFGVVTIGFGSDTTVNNNSKLVLSISFKAEGAGAVSGTSGNDRIDNVAVMGTPQTSGFFLTSPAAGVTLYGGQSETIAYSSSGFVSTNRTINLSTDSGRTWKAITTTSQTTYSWTVPTGTNSSNCFVEVVDSNGVTGVSSRFTIVPQKIVIMQPIAGDTLIYNQPFLLSYTTFGGITGFRSIDISTDSGLQWNEIALVTKDTFTWLVPNTPSNNCFIRITDQNGITATSGKFFIDSVKPPPPPPPPTPTASANLIDYWNFTALSSADTVPKTPRLKAAYSKIDTNTATITDTLQTGTSSSYVGWFDDVAGDTTNHQIGDTSKVALRVRNPSDSMEVLMFMPSTGFKNLAVQYGLESSSTKSGQLVEVFDYSPDGGTTWKSSALTVQGSNVDTLDVTNAMFQGTSWGLVTVTFGNDSSVNNNPNLVLRIKFRGNTTGTSGNNRIEHVTLTGTSTAAPPPPPVPDSIVVTAPMAGDTLLAGTQETISYTVTSSTSAKRTIQYSTNGGTTWLTIDTGVTALTFAWTVPSTPSTQAVVRVKDSAGVIGMSAPFVIVVPGSVSNVAVSQPQVDAGGTMNITWSATGYIGNSLEIDVSYDGKLSWNPITTIDPVAPSGSYLWTTPNILSTYDSVYLRLSFASGTMGFSQPFDIIVPASASVSGHLTKIAPVLWPNPAQNSMHIVSGQPGSIAIYDAMGSCRMTASIADASGGSSTLDITSLPAGAYFVNITDKDWVLLVRSSFVKE